MIRDVTPGDYDAITTIYNHYIEHDTSTFEEDTISTGEMARRIKDVEASGFPWLVMEQDGELVGYAYAKAWHVRSAYRFTAEPTVYLAHQHTGAGLATPLYQALFERLRAQQIKQLIAVITLPNPASSRFHDKLGMEKVGHFKDVGFKFGKWMDVGYWQLSL
ncbi:GNAT family N-acetyltransferase [Aliagarivorans taiwanensis]|uniref:GNAT family N-acetyltransferase n=1 Tax=Aliagarivorans taiwanensis TaxID=561966 RepID=UPI000410E39B|nr:GNAT family N-acetyltransferase [Aliagarivorans taiwanensis]